MNSKQITEEEEETYPEPCKKNVEGIEDKPGW